MDETTIILCGGQINFANLPIGSNHSNAMIPVNGKPVIGWILDDLLLKDIRSVVIVLRENNHRLAEFVQRAYGNRIKVKMAWLTKEETIIQSLYVGLMANPVQGLVRVILGDTLIRDAFISDQNFVYVGEVEESRRWCLAVPDRNGCIITYVDKQETASKPYLALAGYYHFRDGITFQHCLETAVSSGESELSEVLYRYGMFHAVHIVHARNWYDFGNLDNFVSARQRLLQPRFFNALNINPILGTITKESENNVKLREELMWYLALPNELTVLTPRIVNYHETNGKLRIVQEYYGYPTLAELYVYGELHVDTWKLILKRVLDIHREFTKYQSRLEPCVIESMYAGKTFERVQMLMEHEQWRSLFGVEQIYFNGMKLVGWKALISKIWSASASLSQNASICVMHGDYCFSNILYDLGNQIIRIIDPRGNFGIPGIYGDARYDIAKLRHSICDCYDYIVADMYEVCENDGRYEAQIYHTGLPTMLGEVFDQSIVAMGYDLDEIRFIEALLFISMIPLHSDYPMRQLMMFLTGLRLLNEVFYADSNRLGWDYLSHQKFQ